MNRRNFVKAAALLPLQAGTSPLSLASISARETVGGALPTATHAPLRDRFELSLLRALHGSEPAFTKDFLLADVRPVPERRFTEYSGDLSGRYIGALATAARVYGQHFLDLDALVEEVIALQKPDGYFGGSFHYEKTADPDLALLWGNGRLLVGLVEYYRLKPSAAVLASCRRLGDFLVRIGPLMLSREIREQFGAQHFASSYICWMQQTEGLANLYMVTKDARYRELAEAIAKVIERRPGDHVHGYLTSLRGVMDLYTATADASLLRQCETAWHDVAQSQDALITGGVPEGWSPNNHYTEGCGEADWVRLSLLLWKATGNLKYLSMAECTIFNELAFSQFATGDFAHRVYTETGRPAEGAARAWWCCTLHGLRAFPEIHGSVFRAQDDALYYDLPFDGRIEPPAQSAVAESSLAEHGTVRIMIKPAGKSASSFLIRKPEWAGSLDVRLNGAKCELPLENQYAVIKRTWAAGDVLELKYGMQLRSVPSGQGRVVYFYGPWLLGAAASDNFAYFNELTTENRLVGVGKPAPSARRQPVRPFAVPIAATEFRYSPAEYEDQPGPVQLRAIAEQTGQPATSWELRFLVKDQG